MIRASFTTLAIVLGGVWTAAAQPYLGSGAPAAGSIEIGGSAVWTGSYDAGDRSAFLSPNGASSPPLTLFVTSSEVRSSAGAEARLGVYLSSRLAVEGRFQFARPLLVTRITDDFENADPTTASERVSSYLVGGTLLFHFGDGAFVPFVSGGGSYLRQLHENNAVVLTGSEIHAGGGLKYWFGSARHRFGLRLDAEASSRSKSVGFEDTRRVLPVLAAGLTYRF